MGIFLGLGSNLGDRENHIVKAIKALNNVAGVKVNRIAPLYKTPPWGHVEQEWFLNTVVEIETQLNPHQLFKEIKNIEEQIGRTPSFRWGPREIDIDILLFNDQIIADAELEIPHRHLTERAFVLKPLLDLEPAIRHPATKESLRANLERLPEKHQVIHWGDASTIVEQSCD